jgi:hypothetical protein
MALMNLILDDFDRITLGLLLDSLAFERDHADPTEYDVSCRVSAVSAEERERLLDIKDFLLKLEDNFPGKAAASRVCP